MHNTVEQLARNPIVTSSCDVQRTKQLQTLWRSTLYMLARPENKSKVDRLTAEIDAFGRSKVPTFEDLDKFPWLEVRRLSP